MDCDALQFHSHLGDWNVVSMATRYVSVLDDPSRIIRPDGRPLDMRLRGHVVSVLSKGQAIREFPRYRDDIRANAPKGKFALIVDPQSNQPLLDSRNELLMLPSSTAGNEGVKNMVSWRADSGVIIQPSGTKGVAFLEALRAAFPEVNIIRLDMNEKTVANAQRALEWRNFADAAVARGYRLIIQNSDGEMAGGFVSGDTPTKSKMLALDQIGPADALRDQSGTWKINDVRNDWEKMLEWFRLPENSRINDAVIGWELINEPMAYGNSDQAGQIYARHMHDLIEDLDWGGKKILVGGLRASAQFAKIDLDTIRQAAGDRLVWSVHMYPGWVAAQRPDPDGIRFHQDICARIGALTETGDNIALTETQLRPSPANLDPSLDGGAVPAAYNMAREFSWFADNGIGLTWWPPVGRASSFLTSKKGEWRVVPELAAFAHLGWSRNEIPPAQDDAGHFGTRGDDHMTIGHNGQGMVQGHDIANPHGLLFGFEGNDTLIGSAGMDMLYGGPGNDLIQGGNGNDFVFGEQGDDTIEGGGGDDFLFDPEGKNVLRGGAGNDHIEGLGTLESGDGNDALIATPGDVVMTGGAGADRFLPAARGNVQITDFETGTDKLDMAVAGGLGASAIYAIENKSGGAILTGESLRVTITASAPLSCGDLRTINGLTITIDGAACHADPRPKHAK